MALIFSTHSRLCKLPFFEIIVSKMCTYSHAKLKVNRIEIYRDEVFVIGFYSCRKVCFRWVLNGSQMFSLNIESNHVKSSKKVYLHFIGNWYLLEIEMLSPEYKYTDQMLTKTDQDLHKIYCKKLSA